MELGPLHAAEIKELLNIPKDDILVALPNFVTISYIKESLDSENVTFIYV